MANRRLLPPRNAVSWYLARVLIEVLRSWCLHMDFTLSILAFLPQRSYSVKNVLRMLHVIPVCWRVVIYARNETAWIYKWLYWWIYEKTLTLLQTDLVNCQMSWILQFSMYAPTKLSNWMVVETHSFQEVWVLDGFFNPSLELQQEFWNDF